VGALTSWDLEQSVTAEVRAEEGVESAAEVRENGVEKWGGVGGGGGRAEADLWRLEGRLDVEGGPRIDKVLLRQLVPSRIRRLNGRSKISFK
jgi:hypothetical protein